MKQLLLCRHGKSSWTDPRLSDFDRPLNRRGLHDAPQMGKRLVSYHDEMSVVIVTSSALRAISTAKIFAGELGIDENEMVVVDRLYHASEGILMAEIEQFRDEWSRVIVVGHNPGLSDLSVSLTSTPLRGMPTCGMVAVRFDVDSWVDVQTGKGALEWLDSPKRPGEL